MSATFEMLFTDIHCHLLPEIDDGPKDWEASLAMARMAVANAIRMIVATPHQLGRYEGNTADRILSLTAEAQRRIHNAGLPLTLLPGADVRVQEDLPELVANGLVLTLGGNNMRMEDGGSKIEDPGLRHEEGGRRNHKEMRNGECGVRNQYTEPAGGSSSIPNSAFSTPHSPTHHSSLITHHYLLMELPHEQILPMGRLLYRLHCQGVTGILSHPERNQDLQDNPELLRPWVQQGCLIQVTAGSITGEFGREAQRVSRWLFAENLVHLVATDAHDVSGRRPEWHNAFAKICQWESRSRAEVVFLRNPEAVVRGQQIDAPLPSSNPRTVHARRRAFAGWFNAALATLRG
jgi:tyrosine-protein phosphatase YwqE